MPGSRAGAAEWRVQAEEHDSDVRPATRANGLGDRNRQAHRGMHRDRDGDQLGSIEIGLVQRLDGEVNGADVMTCAAQEGCRRGNV